MQDNLFSFFSCFFLRADSLYQAFNRYSTQWTAPARENQRFLSGGPLPRSGFSNFWAVDHSCARDSAISERWTTPARGNPRFLSGGLLPRVGINDSWAVDHCRAWESSISGGWTIPVRPASRAPNSAK